MIDRKHHNPLISVIVPTYNCEEHIGETIESILSQTVQNFELIVVDDGSTDETKQVLKHHKERIHYIYQENKGVAAARNHGIRESTGKYVCVVDSDDLWMPDKLSLQMELLKEKAQVALVFGNCIQFGAEIKGLVLWSEICHPHRGHCFRELLCENFIPNPTVMVRKKHLDKVGYFDETFQGAADWELWLRIARYYEIDYVQKPVAKYRLRSVSMSSDRDHMLRDHIKVLEKHTNMLWVLTHMNRTYRKRFFLPYYTLGIRLYQKGEKKEAVKLFTRYITGSQPTVSLPYKYLVAAMMPATIMRWQRKLRGKAA